MTPLLFAAALALSGPIQQPLDAPTPSVIIKMLPSAQLGSFVKPQLQNGLPMVCNRSTTQTLGPNGAPLQKLTELPPGVEEHAVLRMVNGCPVREIIFAGQTYYLDAPTGGLERDLRGSRIAQH